MSVSAATLHILTKDDSTPHPTVNEFPHGARAKGHSDYPIKTRMALAASWDPIL
jgi:hypothetical protein